MSRLSSEELKIRYPSMKLEEIVERYYGDIPCYTINSDTYRKFKDSEDQTIANISACDAYIASEYGENEVEHYSVCCGSVDILKRENRVLNANITLKYRGMGYVLTIYNKNGMSKGFTLWTSYAGRVGIKAYWSNDCKSRVESLGAYIQEMELDECKKVLNIKSDEHGKAIQMVKELALSML